MQGIYDDGVGDVQLYIDKGVIIKVDKEDNYRCSQQVIKFINQLRNDPIRQELALKENETVESRQGFVKLYVKKYLNKPHTRSSEEEKNSYLLELKKNIAEIRKDMPDDLKILLLTNKSISKELGFENLYNIFNERYSDVKDEIEKELAKIQILDIVELIRLYHNKSYNELLLKFKKNGFYIKSIDDKNKLIASLNSLIELNLSLKETVDFCISNSLIKKTERAGNYELNSQKFLQEFNSNVIFTQLEGYYEKGFNTVNRVNTEFKLDYDQQEFDDFLYNLKKKRFYKNLFSKDLKFNEVLHYFNYLNEEANYITMHKTKGSGIKNVLVVLDEYFWSKYQFKSVYKKEQRSLFNQKLFYVSCSRAIKNLSILRFVENEDEETDLVNYFKNCEIIKT
jgi:DNA helicase-2/ATP-dependent DNA helicase PcrA